jgi:hypothetical protein
MNATIRRTLLLSAAVVPMAASLASAQYRVDNGNARDANNRVGSGGYNDVRNDAHTLDSRIGGTAGNYVVTGNVAGGRSFRGNVGYGSASSFRSKLGSSDFDSFIRDSTGVGQIRGGYGANMNGANTQLFFGSNTAAAPTGFVRSPTNNGTFVPRTTTPVLANDGRADYGGASRAQVTQSLIATDQRFGNAGFATPGDANYGGQYGGPNFGGLSQPLQLSEFTTLARQRKDLYGNTVDSTGRIDMQAVKTTGTNTPPNPFDTPSKTITLDPSLPDLNDNRSPSALPIGSQPPIDPTAQPGDTGQSLSRLQAGKGGVLENNSQYALLRNRLDQARGQMANDPSKTIGGPINTQTVGAGTAVSTGQGRIDTPLPTAAKKPGDDKAPETDAKPTDTDAKPREPIAPTAGSTEAIPEDKLGLPRPEGAAVTSVLPTPVEIKSLAAGVKDPKLAQVLTQAEDLMKAGKFASAIDTYERAEEIASDDPLVFMGRSIAELGGGYFRNAEVHLRQAYAADQSVLYAKFDLRSMLGDERMNQLATKLGDVANKNASDPGPLMLLAFIYYNGGMEDKAARALDMAQVRAGGKDKEVEALRKTWALDAPALNK